VGRLRVGKLNKISDSYRTDKHLYIHTSQITKLTLLFVCVCVCVCVCLQSVLLKQAGVVNYRAQRIIKAAQMFASKKLKLLRNCSLLSLFYTDIVPLTQSAEIRFCCCIILAVVKAILLIPPTGMVGKQVVILLTPLSHTV